MLKSKEINLGCYIGQGACNEKKIGLNITWNFEHFCGDITLIKPVISKLKVLVFVKCCRAEQAFSYKFCFRSWESLLTIGEFQRTRKCTLDSSFKLKHHIKCQYIPAVLNAIIRNIFQTPSKNAVKNFHVRGPLTAMWKSLMLLLKSKNIISKIRSYGLIYYIQSLNIIFNQTASKLTLFVK